MLLIPRTRRCVDANRKRMLAIRMRLFVFEVVDQLLDANGTGWTQGSIAEEPTRLAVQSRIDIKYRTQATEQVWNRLFPGFPTHLLCLLFCSGKSLI